MFASSVMMGIVSDYNCLFIYKTYCYVSLAYNSCTCQGACKWTRNVHEQIVTHTAIEHTYVIVLFTRVLIEKTLLILSKLIQLCAQECYPKIFFLLCSASSHMLLKFYCLNVLLEYFQCTP